MEIFIPVLAAVLIANILTAMFVYGAIRLSTIKIGEDRLDGITASCFLTPLGALAVLIFALKAA